MTPTVPNLGVIGVVGVTSFRIVLFIARMHVTDSSCYRRRHDVIITHNKYYFTMTFSVRTSLPIVTFTIYNVKKNFLIQSFIYKVLLNIKIVEKEDKNAYDH